MIQTMNGGMAQLSKVQMSNGLYCTLVSRFDSAGNVILATLLKDGVSHQEPGVLAEDPEGNLFVFGTSTFSPGPVVYHHITRISKQGQISWSKKFSLGAGGVRGGIATSDSGFLFLTGNYVVKTDKNGNLSWTNFCNFEYGQSSGFSTETAPIEEDDGYLLTFDGSTGFSSYSSIFKISKNGQVLLWQKDEINIGSNLKKNRNGNWISCYSMNGTYFVQHPTFFELDSGFHVVRSNQIRVGLGNDGLTVSDFQIRDDGSVLFSGKSFRNGIQNSLRAFIAVTAPDLQMGCGDTEYQLPDTIIIPGIVLSPWPGVAVDHPYLATNQTLKVVEVSLTDTVLCGLEPYPILALAKDPVICPNEPISLSNTTPFTFDEYHWSTGDRTSNITVNKPGTYWLETVNHCLLDTLRDTIVVVQREKPAIRFLADTVLCDQPFIRLSPEGQWDHVQWQDGSTDSVLFVREPGSYFAEVSNGYCTSRFETTISECELLRMPTLFTPNDDGLNETFKPIQIRGISNASLVVYNRWGRKVFSTPDLQNNIWDGGNMRDGIYFWHIDYVSASGKSSTMQGNVSLIR